ncbi:MAG: TonB-dependent receptor [Flavobacteriales bacterium]|nr:TonB-dependent receptor [Flavobacteriales bacterium]
MNGTLRFHLPYGLLTRILFSCAMVWFMGAQAQGQITQTIRGTVVDSESKFPLPGVTVQLLSDTSQLLATASDVNGKFELTKVRVGRHKVKFSFIGYQSRVLDNVIVNSGKETVLNISLEEAVTQIEAAEIQVTRDGEALNEMATVSARQFDVAETDRYAGSRGDPARMASNFAGVQGADDSRNDIVVRGNSPQGILWRLENIDIPNPNHFSIPGTGGGPVAVLNNKFLSNSDFFTGAFPAEYGNSIAGVFDVNMRNGNAAKHQFSGQFGLLGTEVLAEGPINREKSSSYLVSYRYSTASLFQLLGIDIGTSAVPKYQDGAFRISLPQKNGGVLALWGIGGASSVDILISDQEQPERNIFGDNDRDQYFKSRMAIGGLSWSQPLNERTYVKAVIAGSHDRQISHHELVHRHLDANEFYVVDSLVDLMGYNFIQNKVSNALLINSKISKKHILKAGMNTDVFFWNYTDSIRTLDSASANFYQFQHRWGSEDAAALIQPYIQWKWKPNDNWVINAGLHNQFFTLNNSQSWLEPRLGVRHIMRGGHTLSLGVGRHSQLQPTYLYFYQPYSDAGGKPAQYNRNMDFTRSDHVVLAYDKLLGKTMRIKVETYYQRLYNIPVTMNPSSFSLVNTGAGFSRFFPDSLENTGTGKNYGVEITLEKFFSKGYFFLVSASVFESFYTGSDGVERDTDFNGNYAWNALGGKEWSINEAWSIVTGGKVTMAGGRRYGPADIVASNAAREVIYVDSLRNSLQFRDYFRADLKINVKWNRPKATHELGVDLVNITNQKNVLKLTYAPDESNDPQASIREEYQLGFLPIFFYRVDF